MLICLFKITSIYVKKLIEPIHHSLAYSYCVRIFKFENANRNIGGKNLLNEL